MKYIPQAARLAVCAVFAAAAIVGGVGVSHVQADSHSASAIGAKKDTGW